MKLADWLAIRNPDGSRKRKRDFAAKIGVSPTMVTEYAEGRMWPGRERIEAIVRETNGEVGPTDFVSSEAQEKIAAAARREICAEAS
jgi:DNA-binding transcriptional regulator YdaS (Cro superfamily)